ncbi:MAG: hypothetical protein NT067_05155, partial [Candidatus Diapherotrites archaeon]|nr:hypothetical protein [Candidatus Diapherotrites archaeon]
MNKKLFILFFLLFFLELVFAEGFKFPVFEQQNLGCDSGAAVSEKYGLNRVLLEWDADKITETMCDPLLKENESGYFCDATQLSIMAFKRFESLKEKAREVYAGLDDASKKKLEEVSLLRPAKLSDLGVVANMD